MRYARIGVHTDFGEQIHHLRRQRRTLAGWPGLSLAAKPQQPRHLRSLMVFSSQLNGDKPTAFSKDLKANDARTDRPVAVQPAFPPWKALRERPLWGRSDHSSIDAWSIVTPGPMVVDRVIFFIYTPLDAAGLAFLRSASTASRLPRIASGSKLILPMPP